MDGVAVEVTGGGGGGGGAVRDRVGGCFRDEDVGQGDIEGLGGDDGHFGVQALAHFAAAVGDKDGAVVVDVDEGAGLVEEDGGEGDTEFGGDDGEAAFVPFVLAVEIIDRFSALGVVGFGEDLLIHQGNVPVLEFLIEMGDFVWFVHIDLTKLFYRHTQTVCDFGHVGFCNEHSLGTSKPAKCCV